MIILLISVLIPDNYIKGTILDDENNPINGVNVYIVESGLVTLSDENGKFIIDVSNNQKNYTIYNQRFTLKFTHIKVVSAIKRICIANGAISILFFIK